MARTIRRTAYVPAGKTSRREPRRAPRRTGTRAAVVATARREHGER
jgi:hypothetical protein